jgi:hypothetical protein
LIDGTWCSSPLHRAGTSGFENLIVVLEVEAKYCPPYMQIPFSIPGGEYLHECRPLKERQARKQYWRYWVVNGLVWMGG